MGAHEKRFAPVDHPNEHFSSAKAKLIPRIIITIIYRAAYVQYGK